MHLEASALHSKCLALYHTQIQSVTKVLPGLQFISWMSDTILSDDMTILLVTHDRAFMEAMCTKVLELDHGKGYLYDLGGPGSYKEFQLRRQERRGAEAAAAQDARVCCRIGLQLLQLHLPQLPFSHCFGVPSSYCPEYLYRLSFGMTHKLLVPNMLRCTAGRSCPDCCIVIVAWHFVSCRRFSCVLLQHLTLLPIAHLRIFVQVDDVWLFPLPFFY